MANGNLSADYFERMYAGSDDPWGFASRWYERRKYDLTLAALPNERYRRAFEPGCSIGVLSERLAARCDELLCCELIPRIADVARSRLGAFRGASVINAAIPDFWPSDTFDLVLLSEVAYYLDELTLAAVLGCAAGSIEPGGHLVSVHYTRETDYPLAGRDVQETVMRLPGFDRHSYLEDREFSLVVMQRGE